MTTETMTASLAPRLRLFKERVMLRAKEIHDRLVREAAQKRLVELDEERQILVHILDGGLSPAAAKAAKARRVARKPKRTQSKAHWTQTAEGRARMSKLMKAKYAGGWEGAHESDRRATVVASALPETDQSTH